MNRTLPSPRSDPASTIQLTGTAKGRDPRRDQIQRAPQGNPEGERRKSTLELRNQRVNHP